MLQRQVRNDPKDQYPELVRPVSEDYRVRAIRMMAILVTKADPPGSADELREALEALGLIDRLKPPVSLKSAPAAQGDQTGTAEPSTDDSDGKAAPRKPRRPRDTSLCGKRRHAMTGDNVRIRSDGRRRCRACTTDWAGGKRLPKIPPPPRPDPVDPGPRKCRSGTHLLPDGGQCRPCKNERAKRARAKIKAAGKAAAQKSAAELRVLKLREATIKHAREILAAVPNIEVPPLFKDGVEVPRCETKLHYKAGDNLGARQPGTNKLGRCLACDRISRAKIRLRKLEAEETA